MSEQDGTHESIKHHGSRKTSISNQQKNKQTSPAQRPTNNDTEVWKAYWKAQGQPWRTEPEIDRERQRYLAERRAITPDLEQGIYPFRNITLNRADVEWLLVTHENGKGPVDWSNESQLQREGLDLRGVNLSQENLSGLPLTRMRSGLLPGEWQTSTEEQRSASVVHLEATNLASAQLQGAELAAAQLQNVSLVGAQLQGATLRWAQLQGANLGGAQLQQANLREVLLEGAYLRGAQLQQADLREAQLQGVYLREAQLQGADLRRTDLDHATLYEVTLNDQRQGPARLADISWSNVNLAAVDWSQIPILGDEQEAQQRKVISGAPKGIAQYLEELQTAVRANRQLAVALRGQGINEEADHFAYRAQVIQRKVFWVQMREEHVGFSQRFQSLGRWLFSWFLNVVAGYGFKPVRWLIVYLGVIMMFGVLHYFVGTPPLTWLSALTISILNLHGRPFLSAPSGPEGLIDIMEAFVGLIVEAVLIGIITQRILGK